MSLNRASIEARRSSSSCLCVWVIDCVSRKQQGSEGRLGRSEAAQRKRTRFASASKDDSVVRSMPCNWTLVGLTARCCELPGAFVARASAAAAAGLLV